MKVFITSQFSCPLIRMFHSRTLNNRINNIHEITFRLTYKDNKSSFKELLEKDHSVTAHHKTLQVLVTEIFKFKNDLAFDIMKDVLELKSPNTTFGQNQITLHAEMLRLLTMVSSIKHVAPQICELVPQTLIKCKTSNEFKTKIKSWYPDHCPCRLCKTYIALLGFIWSAYIHLFMAEPGYVLVIIVYLQYDVIMLP